MEKAVRSLATTVNRISIALGIGLLLITALLIPCDVWSLDYHTHLFAGVHDGTNGYGLSEVVDDELSANRFVSYVNRVDTEFHEPLNASASSGFSLRTGEINFQATAMGNSASATGNASIKDIIYPYWGLSTKDDPMLIELTWEVTGNYTLYRKAFVGGTYDQLPWIEDTAGTPLNFSLYSIFYYNVDGGTDFVNPTSTNLSNLKDGVERWTASFWFDPVNNDFITIGESAVADFTTYRRQMAVADFSHTGTVQVKLPDGAYFTSGSQVFLVGEGTSSVPEPTTMLLLGLGLMGLAGVRRKIQN